MIEQTVDPRNKNAAYYEDLQLQCCVLRNVHEGW